MSSESYFKVPKESDFLKIIEDAEDAGILEDQAPKAVNNPLSWLRFIPTLGVNIRQAEKEAETQDKQNPLYKKGFKETSEEKDLAKEIDRAIIGGSTRAVKGILEFVTAGIDLSGKTDLTNKLDGATRKFLLEHGNPTTFAGDATEIAVQYGLPSTLVLKLAGNLNKIKNVRKLGELTNKTIGKIKNKYFRGTADLAIRAGKGGVSLSIADMALSDTDRPTLFTGKVDEKGLEGKDLAIARFTNKLKYAQEGFIIGGGIPLVGKAINLGGKFGLWATGKTIGIGAKTANALVINPLSNIGAGSTTQAIQGVASRLGDKKGILATGTKFLLEKSKPLTQTIDLPGKYLLPPVSKVIKETPKFLGTQVKKILPKSTQELPAYKDWRMFSVESADPIRKTLKKVDNGLSWLRSIGKNTPEMAAITTRGEKEIVSKARQVEKLLESIERKAYDLAKASEKMYDTKLTSPALRDKHLDDVLEYFKNQRSLKSLPKELQSSSKLLNDLLMETKNTFAKMLPKDSLIKDSLMDNIRGYMRKSYGVFTNPNYSVPENSTIFKDAVAFVKTVIGKNRALKETAEDMAKRDRIPLKQATEKLARDEVNDILRYAKTDNRDPIQTITQISKKKLRIDKVISTGEELPDVIRKLLGQENNMKNTVLQTVSNLSTQSTNKRMFDKLGEMMTRTGQLFKNKEAAELAYRITPDKLGKGVRQVDKIDGLGLLKTNTSKLYGPIDLINDMTTLQGPLDNLAKIPIYKNFLQAKVATQYGKTVLSPATQTRNFTFASVFVINRGLLGGRASVMDSIKMATDDIFNAGKLGGEAEKRLLASVDEGIKYGALDENLVAAELTAVLRAIRKNSIKDTDQLTKYLETKGMLRTASRIYAGGDNVWKWYAYNWYKSYLTDYAKKDLKRMYTWFDEVADQKLSKTKFDGTKMDLEEAIKQASAFYVRSTMPTYSLVPRAIQAIKTTPFGNFISFPAEMIRTSFNTMRTNLREMSSSDPILRSMGYRGMMGQYLTMGGLSMGTHAIFNTITGVSEDLIDKYKMYVAPGFQKNADLVPITKVDENGIFKMVDLSSLIGYDTVTRPIEAIFNKFKKQKNDPQSINRFLVDLLVSGDGPIGELISPFADKTIFFETISEITNNKKKQGGKIYSDLAIETGDFLEIILKSAAHAGKKLEPGAFTTGRQLYSGFREQLTGTGSSYNLEDVLMGLGTGVKPIKVDLKRSMDFFITDLKNVRTEAPQASNMYKQNRSVEQIKADFIQQQRLAWRQQQRLYKAFNTMIEMGLDEDFIYDEADTRKLGSNQLDMSLDGEFAPLTYSEPRFEGKILSVEENLEKTGSRRDFDEDLLFPQDELDEIIDILEEADLNGEFPFDLYEDGIEPMEPLSTLPSTETIQTSKLPVQPLPPQPAVRVASNINASPPFTSLPKTDQFKLLFPNG